MKRLFAIIIALALCFALCACGGNRVEISNDGNKPSRFVVIDYNSLYDFYVAYDRETKVMYAVSDGSYNRGSFTMLVNADGTPLLYKGE